MEVGHVTDQRFFVLVLVLVYVCNVVNMCAYTNAKHVSYKTRSCGLGFRIFFFLTFFFLFQSVSSIHGIKQQPAPSLRVLARASQCQPNNPHSSYDSMFVTFPHHVNNSSLEITGVRHPLLLAWCVCCSPRHRHPYPCRCSFGSLSA